MFWSRHVASGMAVLVGDDSGATLLTDLDFKVEFLCFHETSKGEGGANHPERGGTLGGGSRDFFMYIKLV